MAVLSTKLTTKESVVLTSHIKQLMSVIGISSYCDTNLVCATS